MSGKIPLLLNIAECGLFLGVAAQAQGLSDGRNPFAFPAGVLKGADGLKKEGAGPEKAGQVSTPVFRLTTILISGRTRVAGLNGILLREGDELNGYRLTDIETRQVILSRGKEKLVVPIDSGDRYSFKKMNQDSRIMGSSK
jgi:hypothetical protein